MIILALDTCLAACSAAIVDGERVAASVSEPMIRGHQERLAPMVRDLAAKAGIAFQDVDRIGVTIGPGSFTGLRVGLAFAKGLALALDRPCVGVGTLDALAASSASRGYVAAVIDGGRGQVYLRIFDRAAALTAPDVLPLEMVAARLAEWNGGGMTIIGPGAGRLEGLAMDMRCVELAAPGPEAVAALAALAPLAPPRPLYLRAPDARPRAR
jgi:tRNA threonylcarbamoyladenosine biosynthesis protein TsaB